MLTATLLIMLAETGQALAEVAGAPAHTTAAATAPGDAAGYPHLAQILGALGTLVVLSLCLERAFAFLFEWEWVRRMLEKPAPPSPPMTSESRIPGTKAALTLLVSWILCQHHQFDILEVLFAAKGADALGIAVTSLVVAGGSAGAIALFQGVLGFSKPTRDAQINANEVRAATNLINARSALAQAQSGAPVGMPPGDSPGASGSN